MGVTSTPMSRYVFEQLTTDNYLQQRLALKQMIVAYIFVFLLTALSCFVHVTVTIETQSAFGSDFQVNNNVRTSHLTS